MTHEALWPGSQEVPERLAGMVGGEPDSRPPFRDHNEERRGRLTPAFFVFPMLAGAYSGRDSAMFSRGWTRSPCVNVMSSTIKRRRNKQPHGNQHVLMQTVPSSITCSQRAPTTSRGQIWGQADCVWPADSRSRDHDRWSGSLAESQRGGHLLGILPPSKQYVNFAKAPQFQSRPRYWP